jgi:hypothetical protein
MLQLFPFLLFDDEEKLQNYPKCEHQTVSERDRIRERERKRERKEWEQTMFKALT